MPQSRTTKKLFKAGINAVRAASGNGRATATQIKSIEEARQVLLQIIQKLARDSAAEMEYAGRALHDLHPNRQYCQAMLIRDLADVCVTLRRLERGEERTSVTKVAEAAICLTFIADELGA